MRLHHVALWTRDLDAAMDFCGRYFGAVAGEEYRSARRPGFVSRFLRLPGGDRIELMQAPWIADRPTDERVGWDHVAISLGSVAAVDELAERCRCDGVLVSAPRTTGDGFYEAVIAMPDGVLIEITA